MAEARTDRGSDFNEVGQKSNDVTSLNSVPTGPDGRTAVTLLGGAENLLLV
jgi:hypothetical protein